MDRGGRSVEAPALERVPWAAPALDAYEVNAVTYRHFRADICRLHEG